MFVRTNRQRKIGGNLFSQALKEFPLLKYVADLHDSVICVLYFQQSKTILALDNSFTPCLGSAHPIIGNSLDYCSVGRNKTLFFKRQFFSTADFAIDVHRG